MGDELNNLVSCISALPAVELREQNFFCFCFYHITWRVEVFSVQFKEEWCLLHLFPIHRRSPPVTLWKLIKWNVNLNNHVGSILVTFATLTHKCNSKCASVFVRWLWNLMTRIGFTCQQLFNWLTRCCIFTDHESNRIIYSGTVVVSCLHYNCHLRYYFYITALFFFVLQILMSVSWTMAAALTSAKTWWLASSVTAHLDFSS